MKKATMFIDFSFWIKCPYCGHDIDLACGDYDCDNEYSKHIFNNNWDALKGVMSNCCNCEQDFIIDDVDIF